MAARDFVSSLWPFGAQSKAAPPARGRRSFAAARTDRLASSWTTADETVNQAALAGLRKMRARSREFSRDNEYGRKFFSVLRSNIVGSAGFSLKVDCRRSDGSLDKGDSKRVAAAYKLWTKVGNFEVTGKLSEKVFDALAINMIARDGEVLIRLVPGNDRGVHRFQVQLLGAHLLDETHNRDLAGGARIRMGVEFDAFMKPAAYHLRKSAPSADMVQNYSQRYERIPAAEILHIFLPEEIEQWRGIPWASAALSAARQHNQFNEAALVAANVGAAKMGFFKRTDPDAGELSNETESGDDNATDFITDAEPGTFPVLPDGYDLADWDPEYPNAIFESFTRSVLKRMSSGLLTSYHAISGDLTQVNYSSLRAGTIDERDHYKTLQSWFISAVKAPIFEKWLEHAMIFDEDLRNLPYSKFDKFNAAIFTGRRWDWVDPAKDVKAEVEAVKLRIKSRSQIIRERGGDPDEVFEELQTEESTWGFTPPADAPATPGEPADGDDEVGDDDQAGADKE